MDDRFGKIRVVLEIIQGFERSQIKDGEYVLPQLKLLDEIECEFYAKDKEIELFKQAHGSKL